MSGFKAWYFQVFCVEGIPLRSCPYKVYCCVDDVGDDEYYLQEVYDQQMNENLKVNKTMVKIDQSLKGKDKDHDLDLSSQF